LEPNNTVLDIGFGNGFLIKKIFKKNIPVKIYGIEISQDMVNKVSSKYKKYVNNGNLLLKLENIEKTSFENNLFDKICTINTIYFWEDFGKCFSEIKRILKPNGLFLNVIYTKDYLNKIIYTKYGFKKFTAEEIVNITKENGMEIINTIEIVKNKSYCIVSKNNT
jgi:ubiquinone/menaquinone biosynthesis C-methylase UbiE